VKPKEQASVARRAARQLGLFFAVGVALFALRRASSAEQERPLLVVHVAARASTEEVERAIDEAVLVDQSLSRGGALLDPIVRDQVLRSMRVSTGEEPEADQALLDRALSLGIHRADPLVRKRLAFQAEQVLRGRVRPEPPTEGELERYLSEHAERYRKPARQSFTHVFVSRARHPDDLEQVAARLAQRFIAEQPLASDAFRYSEPTILPLHIARASEAEVASRFGEPFLRGLRELDGAGWQGPIASSYGLHLVLVSSREAAGLDALAELRPRLLSDRERDLKTALVAREVRRLRSNYRIDVRRATPD